MLAGRNDRDRTNSVSRVRDPPSPLGKSAVARCPIFGRHDSESPGRTSRRMRKIGGGMGRYRKAGGPRVPMPELSSSLRGQAAARGAIRMIGADAGTGTGPSTRTTSRTLDAAFASAASALRISNAPTGIAARWAASITEVACDPWWWPGDMVSAVCPTAWPIASNPMSSTNPARRRSEPTSTPTAAHAPISRASEGRSGETTPPPSACAAIPTAPAADPTKAPRSRAAPSAGLRTGPYYRRS